MADNKEKSEKKETVKYKFGQNDIDLNKYIHNLGTNVQSYMDSLGWNDGQREEFMNAYNLYMAGLKDLLTNGGNRFSTDDFGVITDSTGVLSDSDNDDIDTSGSEYYYDNKGNRITTDDYNALKKKKLKKYNTFSANREVATYFNRIGRAINAIPKESPKNREKFSISKHGFLADWLKRNGASGEKMDLTPYLDMDKYDPETKKRARTNRIAYLQQELSNYINNLDGDYDFEGSAFKSLDDYKSKLLNLIDHLNDGWSNSDMIAANQAGIGGSFYNYFFTEDENPGKTEEQIKAEEEEAKKKAQLDTQNKWIDDQLAIFDKNGYQWHTNNQHNLGKIDSKYWSADTGWNGQAFRDSFREGSPEWEKYYNKDTDSFDYQTYFNDYLANPFTQEGKRAIAGLIGNGYARLLQSGKYQGMYYIPQYDRDRRTNSGLIYDPINGKLFYSFIGDIPDEWNKMIDEYKLANGLVERRDSYKFFKEGGSIEMMQLGGGFDANAWMEEDRQRDLETRGAKRGRTAEQLEAGDRKAGILGIGVEDTAQNTDNGFSPTDYLRLGTIAADIISMGAAFVPGVGTVASAAAGVGSSLGTFFADAFEDGLDWGDVGNLGTNLGMDILGLIPAGGSASKGAKIAKNLARYATRAIAAIGAMKTISNGSQIIDSFKKLSTPTELTVDDWRNISAGLGLITGGVAAGTRKYKQAKMKAANAKPDNIAVEMVKDGTKKTVLFAGDDAKAIRSAKNAEGVKSITSKYEDFKDWDVSTNGTVGWRGFKNTDGKWQNPVGGKAGKARVFEVSQGYDILGNLTGKTFANRGKWEADVELTPANNAGKTVAEVNAEVDAFKNQLLDPMKKESKFVTARRTARENAVKKHEEAFLRLEDLEVKATPNNYNTSSGKPGTGEGLIPAELIEYRLLLAYEPQRRALVLKLRDWLNKVNAEGYHTLAYNDFRTAHVDALGNVNIPVPGTRRAIQGTFEDLIKDLGIFKEGGQLNINRVRKFKEAGKITNTTSKANWFTDIFSSPEMNNWLKTFNVDNFEDFNNLQRSWATNKANTGYSTGMSRISSKNLGVWDRQGLWNNTGTNAAIERAFTNGKITRAGVTGDNANSGYLDGFFGEQEFLRHGGTKESWVGKEAELKAFLDSLKERGLSYTLDDATGMYLLGKLPVLTTPEGLSQGANTTSTTSPVAPKVTEPSDSNNGNKLNISLILSNPTIKYGLLRALYADAMNRKMTDMAILAERPYLQDPFEVHRSVYSDLDAEMQGLKAAANLNSMASRPLTSDGSLQTAAMLEALAKGDEFINLGKEKSNAVARLTSELAWQQEKENAQNRHATAMLNRLALLQSAANKSKYKLAYLSKKHTNWDTLALQLEYEAKARQAENKAYADSFAKSDIHDTVTYDLENQAKNAGISLTPELLTAWNKILSGEATYSTLANDNERRAYLEASKIASLLETLMLREHLGIPASRWSGIRTMATTKQPWEETITDPIPSAKNGAKIAVAGIQAKTKDAERFQRQIKEAIDRNEKALDRLSKSLYGYIKASIVK